MDKISLIRQSLCPSLHSIPGPLVDMGFTNTEALSVLDNSIDAVENNSCGHRWWGLSWSRLGARCFFEDRILDLAMFGMRGTILIPDFTKLSR